MLDDIIETAIPWGGFLAAGALLGASFPDETRDFARRAAVVGMRIADKARELGAEGWERGQDILAEAQVQHESERREREGAGRSHLTVMEGAAPAEQRQTPRPRSRRAPVSAGKATPRSRRPVTEN